MSTSEIGSDAQAEADSLEALTRQVAAIFDEAEQAERNINAQQRSEESDHLRILNIVFPSNK